MSEFIFDRNDPFVTQGENGFQRLRIPLWARGNVKQQIIDMYDGLVAELGRNPTADEYNDRYLQTFYPHRAKAQ